MKEIIIDFKDISESREVVEQKILNSFLYFSI